MSPEKLAETCIKKPYMELSADETLALARSHQRLLEATKAMTECDEGSQSEQAALALAYQAIELAENLP